MNNVKTAKDVQRELSYYARKKINEIEYRDYLEIGISEAQTKLNEYIGDRPQTITKIKKFTSDVEDMYGRFNEYIEETKPKIDKLRFDENSLLFPEKEKQVVREEHLQALQYAEICIDIADNVNNANKVCNEEIDAMLKREDIAFCSDIAFKSTDYSKDAVHQAIENFAPQPIYSVSAKVTAKQANIKLDIADNRIKKYRTP